MKSGRDLHAARLAWDPCVARRHAALAPFAAWFDGLGVVTPDAWPSVATLGATLSRNRITNATGTPLTLAPVAGQSAAAYEQRIAQHGAIGIRPGEWHDVFNVCMWASWPATKAAVNRRHCEALEVESGSRRSPARDSITGFDEDGIVIAVADPGLADLARRFRWRELFVDRRADLAGAFQPFVIGHGLCEKLLAPYIGLTAKAVFVPVDAAFVRSPLSTRLAVLDHAASRVVRDPALLSCPADLSPLPVLGLPDWWPGNADPAFYDDTTYFRAGRRTGHRAPGSGMSAPGRSEALIPQREARREVQ